MLRPSWGIWLTTAVWIVVTGAMWARHDYQLTHGREISLKAVPVDPRDILRGDYVALRYEISAVERGGEDTVPGFLREGQTVFVAIEESDGEWMVHDLDTMPPEDGLFLRGRVQTVTDELFEIDYGIESFFVPEGGGKRYEEARNRQRLYAVVSVSPHGVPHLKRLEIRDGEQAFWDRRIPTPSSG